MFTILADALFTATRARKDPTRKDTRSDWDERFVSEKRRRDMTSAYSFNHLRDLW